MNPFRTRTSAVTVGALAAVMALSGCGAGQVSQMATQAPAVNGTGANIGDINLRNVHLRAVQDTAYIRPGSDVELLFVAANGSDANSDRLISITSDIGTVALSGNTEVKPGLCLAIEPMVTSGSDATFVEDDDWTVTTVDGSDGSHWEHSVAVHADGIWVLTAHDGGAADLAPYGVIPVPIP